jgi:hypothetical protein
MDASAHPDTEFQPRQLAHKYLLLIFFHNEFLTFYLTICLHLRKLHRKITDISVTENDLLWAWKDGVTFPAGAAPYLSSFLLFQKVSGAYVAFFPAGVGYSFKPPTQSR